MPDQLLNLLKLFLLVLLYLFFLRVLRAVWTEVNVPRLADGAAPVGKPKGRSRRAARPGRSHHPHLKVLEPAGLRGSSYPLDEEITLGRAAGCQVPLEDAYASQVHARVFQRDGNWFVEDLGSTNGTFMGRDKLTSPRPVDIGSTLRIGKTVIELRG